MDCSFGFTGKDFVVMVADCSIARQVWRLHDDEDKINKLDGNKLLSISGDAADRLQFGEYVAKNLNLFKYRNGHSLSTKETANFVRSQLAYAIRNGPYQSNCLLGGVDDQQPSLYFMDYIGTLQKTHIASHGYGGMFLWGLLDNVWKKDLSQEEALQIVQKCIAELNTRFLLNVPKFSIKIIDKDGIHLQKNEKK